MVSHRTRNCACECTRSAYAQSRQWQRDVLRRRLCVLSCRAKQEDKTKLGGGLALGSPFGTFYVPNISSDPKDGIGGWSEAQFVTAMVKGTSPSGEHLFPAFPYTSYQRMNFDDLRDLFAYLKTLPAVTGRIRDHALPFPFNIRRTLGGWKLLFLDGKPFQPDPSQSAQWNRAPIWSMDQGTALSVTLHEISWGPSSPESGLREVPVLMGRGERPTLPSKN